MAVWLAAVFVAISHWMHQLSHKRKEASSIAEAAQKLAACIRFPMLTNDFLHFVVEQVCVVYLSFTDYD